MVVREASDSEAIKRCEEAGRRSPEAASAGGFGDCEHGVCYHKSNVPVKELF
jgi:hypothetical protein